MFAVGLLRNHPGACIPSPFLTSRLPPLYFRLSTNSTAINTCAALEKRNFQAAQNQHLQNRSESLPQTWGLKQLWNEHLRNSPPELSWNEHLHR